MLSNSVLTAAYVFLWKTVYKFTGNYDSKTFPIYEIWQGKNITSLEVDRVIKKNYRRIITAY